MLAPVTLDPAPSSPGPSSSSEASASAPAPPARPSGARLARLFGLGLLLAATSASAAGVWGPGGRSASTTADVRARAGVVPDGFGGTLVVWIDRRSDAAGDVYAQRFDSTGTPLWTSGGVPVCTASGAQGDEENVRIISDGAGGAIMTWPDFRAGNGAIFAQRVMADGSRAWAPNGILVRDSGVHQNSPQLVSDGAGGAIIALTEGGHILGQHLGADGSRLWPSMGGQGIGVIVSNGAQFLPAIASDGAGGAYVACQTNGTTGSAGNWKLLIQHVLADGAAVWSDGFGLGSQVGGPGIVKDNHPFLVADGRGGALMVWSYGDFENGTIYARHLTPAGTDWVHPLTGAGGHQHPRASSDGQDFVVAWEDGGGTLLALRLNSSGDALWPGGAVALSALPADERAVQVVADSTGATFAWVELGTVGHVRTQRLDRNGIVQFSGGPLELGNTDASNLAVPFFTTQAEPVVLTTDGHLGVVAAWPGADGDSGRLRIQHLSTSFAPEIDLLVPIHVVAGAHGAIQPAGDVLAPLLSSRSFSFRPDSSYRVSSVTVDSLSVGFVTSYQFPELHDPHELSVAFAPDPALQTTPWASGAVSVATGASNQFGVEAAPDGAGGSLLAWVDDCSDAGDIYVQAFDMLGAPRWGQRGVPLCTVGGKQEEPRVIADGTGGAIVVWTDARTGDSHIYGQRVTAAGAVAWTPGGILLRAGGSAQNDPHLVSDGAGGAVVVFLDAGHIYGQRISPDGTRRWPSTGGDGVPVITSNGRQFRASVASDGAGGAYLACQTNGTTGTAGNWKLLVQHLLANGTAVWSDAFGLGMQAGGPGIVKDNKPYAVADGRGGALVVWSYGDFEAGTMYARHLTPAGTDWVRPLTGAGGHQHPRASTDGHDYVVAWEDGAGSLLTLRLDATGAPLWPSGPLALSTLAADERDVHLVADTSGATYTWVELGTVGHVRMQRLDRNGNAQFTDGPLALGTTDPNSLAVPFNITPAEPVQLIDDGLDGVVVAWETAVAGFGKDIQARRIQVARAPSAGLPVTLTIDPGVQTAPAHQISVPLFGRTHVVARTNEATRVVDAAIDGVTQGAVTGVDVGQVVAPTTVLFSAVADTTRLGRGWSSESEVVAPGAASAGQPWTASDGQGGTLLVWVDRRADVAGDLYVQRLDGAGVPLWPIGGLPVCTLPGPCSDEIGPRIVDDGAGGAIVAWADGRSGTMSVRAQRISAAGVTLWAQDGVLVRASGQEQYNLDLTSDGAGGAITVFGEGGHILGQRIGPDGSRAWPTQGGQGIGVIVSNSAQFWPHVVSDGQGGAFVACQTNGTTGTAGNWKLLAQHVLANGTAMWSDGFGLGMQVGGPGIVKDNRPAIVADGRRGMLMVWSYGDFENGAIYARHFASEGPDWLTILTGMGSHHVPHAFTDGSDYVVAWEDGAGSLLAQRLTSGGAARWPSEAVLSALAADERAVRAAVDSTGAMFTWVELGTPGRVRAQRLDIHGVAQFAGGPMELGTTDPSNLVVPFYVASAEPVSIVPDSFGGAVVSWVSPQTPDGSLRTAHVSPNGRRDFDARIRTTLVGAGSVSPGTSVGVWLGTSQLFSFVPGTGQRIADVRVDGISIGAQSSYLLQDITSDHDIQVRFMLADDASPASWYLLSSSGFDDLQGACRDRGFTGTDLAGAVYAHVSDRFVVNVAPVSMGARALWFGADSTSAPDVVREWLQPYGFGRWWSQRLASPVFDRAAHPAAVLRFDAALGMSATPGLAAAAGSLRRLCVQGQRADGVWVTLVTRWSPVAGAGFTSAAITGSGVVRAEVRLADDGNAAVGLAATTRLRLVVQTDDGANMQDGTLAAGAGAAVIDGLHLTDGALELVSPADFEDGTTQGWALSAANGPARGSAPAADPPALPTAVALTPAPDAELRTCTWSFWADGDTAVAGAYARLASPWTGFVQRDSACVVTFTGRLPALDQGRALSVRLLGKNAGESHPHLSAELLSPLTSSATGADASAPLVRQRALRFPQDFRTHGALGADSVCVVFEVADLRDPSLTSARLATRLPLLDDIRLHEPGVDTDQDGIADGVDACPAVAASGEDANRDGCPDATASLRHVETWPLASRPLHYVLSRDGDARIVDGSDLAAIRAGFAAWQAVPGASFTVIEDSTTAQGVASAFDGVNLITFADDFAFPPNVLAITPTLSFDRRTAYDDRVVNPGEIVDADILFNPGATFSTASTGELPDGFDLQSVATHELGHFLGLSHSGTLRSTMFPVLQPGTGAASLEDDDRAAIASAYPAPSLASGFGTISGTVWRGAGSTPVGGALVLAVRLNADSSLRDTVASDFTREDGHYALRRLSPGAYAVRIQPLDGSTPGLIPGAVNARVAAMSTVFDAEWWNAGESGIDDPAARTSIVVAAAQEQSGRDVRTNLDTAAPVVLRVTPGHDSSGVQVESSFLIEFSKPVSAASLGTALQLRITGQPATLGGHGQLLDPGTLFLFTPSHALAYDTHYELTVGTALTDLQGVPLAAPFVSRITTAPRGELTLAAVTPAAAVRGAIVQLVGAGFDSTARAVFTLCPSCAADTVAPLRITSRELAVAVPAGAVTGSVRVVRGASLSNVAAFTVLTGTDGVPSAAGAAVPLTFVPSGVALSENGNVVFVAGDAGVATTQRAGPVYATPVLRAVGASARVALLRLRGTALVTQPALGRVLELDADPARALGDTLATWRLPGEPFALALAPGERRAYVTDRNSAQLYELDVDVQSPTRGRVLRTLTVAGAVLTHELQVDPAGGVLHVGTTTRGTVHLDLETGLETTSAAPGGDALAMAADGRELASAAGAQLTLTRASGSRTLALPAAARALLASPTRAQFHVLLGTSSRLLTVSADSASEPAIVGDEPAGATPVALAVSGDGATIVVATAADRTLQVFARGAAAGTLARLSPDVAVPGQVVALQGSGALFTGSSTVEIGDSTRTFVYAAAGAGGAVRSPALAQATVAVRVAPLAGNRTASLPLQVIDALSAPDPRLSAARIVPAPDECGAGAAALTPLALALAPDDGTLALLQSAADPCVAGTWRVSWYAGRAGAHALGEALGFTRLPAAATGALAYSSDGRELWVSHAADANGDAVHVLGALAGTPAFAQVQRTLRADSVGAAEGVRFDPLGRGAWVLSSAARRITRVSPAGTVLDTLALPADSLRDAQPTPDGRWLLVLTGDRLLVCDAADLSVLASSVPALQTGPRALVVESGGERAWARQADGSVMVWSLAPGTLATTLHAGVAPGAPALDGAWLPGPDGASVLATSAGVDSVHTLALATGGLRVSAGGLAAGASTTQLALAARSADGRRLWATAAAHAPASADTVVLVSLAGTIQMELLAGDAQSGAPGSELPIPLQVRARGTNGRPMTGVLVDVALPDSTQGTLVGGPDPLHAALFTDLDGLATLHWRLPSAAPALAAATGALVVGTDAHEPTSANPARAALLASLAHTPCGIAQAEALGADVTGEVLLRITVAGAPCALVARANVTTADGAASPEVVSLGPVNGAQGVYAGSVLVVRFTQRMDSLSVVNGLRLSADGVTLPFGVSFADAGRTALVSPASALPFASEVVLLVPAGLRDREGQELARAAVTRFTIEPEPSLALRSISPPAGPAASQLVLSGSGFSTAAEDNVVLMNGVRLPVSVASDRALVVTVPSGVPSGDVRVRVATSSSNALPFRVLEPSRQPGGTSGTAAASAGVRDLALTADGRRVYVTNARTNSVTVFDLGTLQPVATIPVGREPVAIVLIDQPARAYVANAGSDEVSVIDADTSSATWNQVVRTIPVGRRPADVAESATGPEVLVACAGDSSLHLIDARVGSGAFDRVVKTVKLGSSGTSVAVTPDGGRAYIASNAGIVVFDLRGDVVVKTVKLGSGATSVAVTPDGALLFALQGDGQLAVIDLDAGSSNYERVVKTVKVGAGATAVSVTADGGLLYVTARDGDVVYIYSIERGAGAVVGADHAGTAGELVALTLAGTTAVGKSPAAVRMSPDGALAMVPNEGSGTISILATGASEQGALVRLSARFERHSLTHFDPVWAEAVLQPPAGYAAGAVTRARVRLQGLVPPDTLGASGIGDADGDALPDVTLRFRRAVLPAVVAEGARVPVRVSGVLEASGSLPSRTFTGHDTLLVRRASVSSPVAGQTVNNNGTFAVQWSVLSGITRAAVLQTLDGGRTWTLVRDSVANTGSFAWPVPAASRDSVQLAIVQWDTRHADGSVDGTLALSGWFHYVKPLGIESTRPTALALQVEPNPVRGDGLLRFALPQDGVVRLALYDLQGREVARLAEGMRPAGWHELPLTRAGARALSPGLYFARLEAGGRSVRRMLVVMK